MGAVRTMLTMEEFMALPELDAGKRELLEGELIELPPSKFKHDLIGRRMERGLESAITAAGIGGEVYREFGYVLGRKHWLRPDVSIAYPNQPVGDYLEGAPRLAIEIISAGNTKREIAIKIQVYLSHGAQEVWVIYADRGELHIHRADQILEICKGTFASSLLNGQLIDLDEILS
jgi:Uma2 family endonuclease